VVDNFHPEISRAVIVIVGEALGVHGGDAQPPWSPEYISRQPKHFEFAAMSMNDPLVEREQVFLQSWLRRDAPDVFRRPTIYDPYIPWLASELNTAFKPLRRAAKKYLRAPESSNMGDLYVDYNRKATAYRDLEQAALGFASMVHWALETESPLREFALLEALDLASDHAEEWEPDPKTGGFPQGKVVFEFGDGWTIQELTTQDQFVAESAVMQHCVGQKGPDGCWYYDAKLAGDYFNIYSLRDPQGKPHATIEEDIITNLSRMPRVVEQIRGKQNARPKLEYLARVFAWFRATAHPAAIMGEGFFTLTPEEHTDLKLTQSVDVYPEAHLVEAVWSPYALANRRSRSCKAPGACDPWLIVQDREGDFKVFTPTLLRSHLRDVEEDFQDWLERYGVDAWVDEFAGIEFDSEEEELEARTEWELDHLNRYLAEHLELAHVDEESLAVEDIDHIWFLTGMLVQTWDYEPAHELWLDSLSQPELEKLHELMVGFLP